MEVIKLTNFGNFGEIDVFCVSVANYTAYAKAHARDLTSLINDFHKLCKYRP